MTTNDQLKDALATLITQITDWSNHAMQFGADMVPELIRQYLTLAYWKCVLTLGGSVLFVILAALFALGVRKWANDHGPSESVETAKDMSVILVAASLIILAAVLHTDITELMAIKMAPYVYTLQHASDMVGMK